jgi:molybdopterin-guanine dinucleotide biosynthesis protein A
MTLAVILAGGAGRRLGGNKPFHPYGDSTLIEAVISRLKPQVDTLYINAGHSAHPLASGLSDLDLPLIADEEGLSQLGPLSGILTAVTLANQRGAAQVFTVPCDMPMLPPDLVRHLILAPPADVAFMSGRRDHPLCARWSASLAPSLREALAAAQGADGPSVMSFLKTVTAVSVPITDEAAFLNINHPAW